MIRLRTTPFQPGLFLSPQRCNFRPSLFAFLALHLSMAISLSPSIDLPPHSSTSTDPGDRRRAKFFCPRDRKTRLDPSSADIVCRILRLNDTPFGPRSTVNKIRHLSPCKAATHPRLHSPNPVPRPNPTRSRNPTTSNSPSQATHVPASTSSAPK